MYILDFFLLIGKNWGRYSALNLGWENPCMKTNVSLNKVIIFKSYVEFSVR